MSKTFRIVNNDLSDGYHTFDELYDHRVSLWILLCLHHKSECYWFKHYDEWDCLVWNSPKGQMSYHVPMHKQDFYANQIKQIDIKDHKFDGHTSDDVILRLEGLSRFLGDL